MTEQDENFKRLTELMREMFQLDRGDLDFGLYRVMNMKRDEVDKFLTNELLPQVQGMLEMLQQADISVLQAELDEQLKQMKKLKVEGESQTITDLRDKIAEARKTQVRETDIYNHLYQFFNRYYDGGDFMSLRRYKAAGKEAYLVPYNGEEVKLHWANSDQYYIKTTANYQSYVFVAGDDGRRVRFQLAGADNEKDNIKAADDKQRRFVLARENAVAMEDGVLVVRFEHRPLDSEEKANLPTQAAQQQAELNASARDKILKAAKAIDAQWETLLAKSASTEKDAERTVLDKHLTTYVAKNEFDYFIHKDLGGFLRRELDFYLKGLLVLDDVEADSGALERSVVMMKAIRGVANKVITFLAQLEAFQKRLWLKKKFVLETNYCVTLDRVPAEFYDEIAKNDKQWAEWESLFAIGEIAGCAQTAEFLRANPFLVLDTVHFDGDFVDRLLGEMSDALGAGEALEDTQDGLLIHGENFQALNLLQARYQQQVQCIHIDPPYNTKTSGFLYKNGYQHSSWITMMAGTSEFALQFLSGNGHYLCHIDEHERENLHLLLSSIFPHNPGTVTWDKRNPVNSALDIATQHEYILWRSLQKQRIFENNDILLEMLAKAESLIPKSGKITDSAKQRYAKWVNDHKSLTGGKKAYRNLDDAGRVYQSVSLQAPELRDDAKFYEPLIHPETGKPCPVPKNGFSRTPETLAEMLKNDDIIFGKDETTQPRQKLYLTPETRVQLASVIQNAKTGTTDLGRLGLSFPYCHPVSLYESLVFSASNMHDATVLDYFAGSGTTGHAVINLNREDGGKRKYILAEVGHHFDSVLLPRLKKVAYSHDWKAGKPVSREGSTQFFKYLRLESYEDALDSLMPKPVGEDLVTKLEAESLLEDYKLRYALTHETRDAPTLLGAGFDKPDAYTLSVVRDGIRRDAPADLAETFNYLLGISVIGRWRIDGVLAIKGTDRRGKCCLILWRDVTAMDNDALNDWFDRHYTRFDDSINDDGMNDDGIDYVYVNGDQTLNTLRKDPNIGVGVNAYADKWEAQSTEPTFRRLMFEGADK